MLRSILALDGQNSTWTWSTDNTDWSQCHSLLTFHLHAVKWNVYCHTNKQEMSKPSVFWPPNVNEGSQNWELAGAVTTTGVCLLRSSGNASRNHLAHRPLLKVNKELRMQAIRKQNLAPDSKLQELVMDREAWHVAVHGVWTELRDWTELSWSAYERNEFSELRGLHLSICRRTIDSLTGYLIFFASQ